MTNIKKKIFITVITLVLIGTALITVFPFPRRKEVFGEYTYRSYWAGIPPLFAFPGQGSDSNYNNGYILVHKKNTLKLRCTYVKSFNFDGIKWTDSTFTIHLWKPDPPIEWKFK